MDNLRQKKFLKITNKEEKHYDFQYTDGLNILKEPFAETGWCVPGGLYFTDINNIFQFLDYGVHLREITLPLDDPDFKIVNYYDNEWRANKIILGKRYNLWEKKTFEYLVSLGANISAHNDNAVIYASKNGHLDVVKYLVSMGANIRNADYAVISASMGGHLDVVKYLVSLGADKDCAVEWASMGGHLDVVKYLVSMRANIHADNNCAVRYASANGHLDVVKYLVELGGRSPPVQPARIDNSVAVFTRDKIELGESCSPVQPARTNNAVVIRDKVSLGANIHADCDYAVRYACENGHLDVVKYLVEFGADIHTNDNYAVKWASKNGHLDVVKYLVKLGANIHANDDYAAKRASKKNPQK